MNKARIKSSSFSQYNPSDNYNNYSSQPLYAKYREATNGGSVISGIFEFSDYPLRQIFFLRHGELPNEILFYYFTEKFINQFIKKHKKKCIHSQTVSNNSFVRVAVFFFKGANPVYLFFHTDTFLPAKNEAPPKFSATIAFGKRDRKVNDLISILSKNKTADIATKETGYLNILVVRHQQLNVQKMDIPLPDIDFSVNYNEDFLTVHKIILKRLSARQDKGLVLLHGMPGTGKTTYLRYLIHQLKKNIIYIPPNLINQLADPAMIDFLLNYNNTVLIVEDAENILIKRGKDSNQAIANILNLSDGLLSDCANIQIVATFNTDILNIDEALLRKGRLIARYEFKELELDRAEKLSKKLHLPQLHKKAKLSDIYNVKELDFSEKKNKIGF